MTYKLSKFTYEFPTKNGAWLYHSLLLKKVFLTNQEKSELTNYLENKTNHSDLVDKLCEYGFLNKLDDEDALVYKEAQNIVMDWELKTLFLVVTDYCNFKCKYCFENLEKYSEQKQMSEDIAKKAVDAWAKEVKKTKSTKTIFIYGGEPLLNFKVVKFVVEYATKLKEDRILSDPLNIHIITNGSLITPEVADWAKNYQDLAFGVSLDGFKHNHDEMRINNKNLGTYEKVINGIKLLRDRNIEYSILCTIGPHNIYELEDICSFFIKDLGAKNINFTIPLSKIGKGYPYDKQLPVDLLIDKLISASKIIRKEGAYEGTYFKHLIPFVEEKLFRGECDAAGSQVVITPDGKLGPCLAFMHEPGFFESADTHLFDFNIKEKPIFREFARSIALAMEECKTCPSLGICGGGCAYNRYVKEGAIGKRDEYFCEIMNGLLKNFILELDDARKFSSNNS